MVPVPSSAPDIWRPLWHYSAELFLSLLLSGESGDPETVPFTACLYQFHEPQWQVSHPHKHQNSQSWKCLLLLCRNPGSYSSNFQARLTRSYLFKRKFLLFLCVRKFRVHQQLSPKVLSQASSSLTSFMRTQWVGQKLKVVKLVRTTVFLHLALDTVLTLECV